MKFTQQFEVDQARERVWTFFDQPAAVARCVPGVESIDEVQPDVFTVLVTQSVGPFSATFEARLQITEKVAGERIAFKATGKAVRGAIGSFRAESVVTLSTKGAGTLVEVNSEAALAGVLGSVGQKVIARQAEKVTAEFASVLERRLKGDETAGSAAPIRLPAALRTEGAVVHQPALAGAGARGVEPSAANVWMKVAAGAAIANLAITLVILGKLL